MSEKGTEIAELHILMLYWVRISITPRLGDVLTVSLTQVEYDHEDGMILVGSLYSWGISGILWRCWAGDGGAIVLSWTVFPPHLELWDRGLHSGLDKFFDNSSDTQISQLVVDKIGAKYQRWNIELSIEPMFSGSRNMQCDWLWIVMPIDRKGSVDNPRWRPKLKFRGRHFEFPTSGLVH